MTRLSRQRAIAFDFDGTLTCAEFDGRFEREFFARLAIDPPRDERDRDEDVLVDERAVVRAGADPWILATFRATRALRAAGASELDARATIAKHFRPAIEVEPAPFRDGVGALLDALDADGVRCFIVSNSPEASIRARLSTVCESAARVVIVGDAQKFSIVDAERPLAREWQRSLGASRRFAGAPRETLLGRGRYLDALARVCERAECAIDELTVVGDVFELDLVVPLLLGARGCSIDHDGRAPWERAALASLRATSAADPQTALAR